jgi:hypothetical protein
LLLLGEVFSQPNQWKLIWDKNPDSNLINHYIVYRGIGIEPTESDTFCIAPHPYNVEQDTVMIIDSLLVKNTEYFYNIVAVDIFGRRSDFSNVVSAVNHPPDAKNDYIYSDEDVTVKFSVHTNDIAYDCELVPSSVKITSSPLYGRVSIDGAGIISYWPPEGWNGTDLIRYTIKDSEGAVSNSAEITIVVNSINDIPLLANLPDSIFIDSGISYKLQLDKYAEDNETPDSLLNYEFTSKSDNISWIFHPTTRELSLSSNPGFDTISVFYVKVIDDSNAFYIDSIYIHSQNISDIAGDTYINFPQTHQLFQNYPNPFNPSTTIEFVLPKPEYVELKVFNMLGREVASLISNNMSAGVHQYQFNGSDLASGIYYYQLIAGDYMGVKKMILLK